MPRPDLYFSADVEADGPIPGPYSMLSCGLVVAGSFDGVAFTPANDDAASYYVELKPISEQWIPGALAVSGLDRNVLRKSGRHPADVMTEVASWVRTESTGYVPVLVAYPAVYDWMWLYWYFERFASGGSPFGHSRCLDLKTLYAARAGVPVRAATKHQMPAALRSRRPHTHHALDDAREQADLLANLMTWDGTS